MSALTDITPGIMRAVKVWPDRWRAQVLFDKCTFTTDYGYIGVSEEDIRLRVCVFHPNVKPVTNKEFLAELDHIKLFGCRSDKIAWSEPLDDHTKNIIEKHMMAPAIKIR